MPHLIPLKMRHFKFYTESIHRRAKNIPKNSFLNGDVPALADDWISRLMD